MAFFSCMARSSDPQFCLTHHMGVPLVAHCNFDRVDHIVVPKSIGFYDILSKSSMWQLWLATLVSKNWLMHTYKGFGGPSWMRQWLFLFIRAPLVCKQKIVLQSLLVYCSPLQSQNLASPPGALTSPPTFHSLMDVTQFSLVWIASQNTQF